MDEFLECRDSCLRAISTFSSKMRDASEDPDDLAVYVVGLQHIIGVIETVGDKASDALGINEYKEKYRDDGRDWCLQNFLLSEFGLSMEDIVE